MRLFPLASLMACGLACVMMPTSMAEDVSTPPTSQPSQPTSRPSEPMMHHGFGPGPRGEGRPLGGPMGRSMGGPMQHPMRGPMQNRTQFDRLPDGHVDSQLKQREESDDAAVEKLTEQVRRLRRQIDGLQDTLDDVQDQLDHMQRDERHRHEADRDRNDDGRDR